MKKALVRNGRHQRPLIAVLTRYGIGQQDGYDRGLWITEAYLPRIEAGMASDKSRHDVQWNGRTFMFVNGTNMHNDVSMDDFNELFE